MNFLDSLIKSEEELQKFLKEYDEHIGLAKRSGKQQIVEPEFKFQFGGSITGVRK